MKNEEVIVTEMSEVQDELVNTSLVVATIAGLPLLFFSILRSLKFERFEFLVLHSIIYCILLGLTLYRKRIHYNVRANFILTLIICVGIIDLLNVGFMSLGYIWFVLGVVLSFLLFSLRYSMYVLVLSILSIFIIKFLHEIGLLIYDLDLNPYSHSDIVVILRTINTVLISAVIVFSFNTISNKFKKNIVTLDKQKENLMDAAIRMKREMEIRERSEKIALDSEKRFRNIFENSSDPMVILDDFGNIIDYNQTFQVLSEVADDMLKKINIEKIIPDDYREYFKQMDGHYLELPTRFDLKYRSDLTGELKYLDVSTTVINYDNENVILALFNDMTEKRFREQNIYSAAVKAEESERLRMSKELHDGLGPLLSTLKIYYQALERKPDDKEIQKRIWSILNDSITSVKEISNNLSPYVLQNLGVSKALKAFVEKIEFAGKLKIDFTSNIVDRFNENLEISVYRLITELINNTIKHANAKKVDINLLVEGGRLHIDYKDDGEGLDTEKLKQNTFGIGLYNMRNRIEMMGGVITIVSSKGNGFELSANIELHESI